VRLGILGGTFNPPHLGHLISAQEAYVHFELDRVMLIPARIPPHKPVEDEPGVQHRLELCRLAVQGDDRFTVSDLEVVRPGPSYTVDTLKELTSKAPDSELFLILGGDIAAGLPDWHQPEQVVSLSTLAVAERPGTTRAQIERALGRLDGADRAEFFPMPRIDLSSTEIRRRVKEGQPIRYIVPDAVAAYIREHQLYGGSTEE
jgi:nicotinate-nucleotide adenylyltransferase